MAALSTFDNTPYLTSVTAPCALPSADVTTVLTVPASAVADLLVPGLAIVNVVVVGALNTIPFLVNVVSTVVITCTSFPGCKLCSVTVLYVATSVKRVT